MEKIESTRSLLHHLNKCVAACRKSYRLCGGVHLSIHIISGLVGCGAAAALIPAVSIATAIAGAIPAGITVVLRFAKLEEKMVSYKAQFRVFKQLFTEARFMSAEKNVDKQEVIKELFSRIQEIEKETNYVAPLERYMKQYKFNGYYSANDEDKLPITRYI